jgi:hypothetical protein
MLSGERGPSGLEISALRAGDVEMNLATVQVEDCNTKTRSFAASLRLTLLVRLRNENALL